MAKNNHEQLTEFASLFLSTDSSNWDSPTSLARASSLLPTALPDNHVLCSVTSFSLKNRKQHSHTHSKESLALDVATSFNDELHFTVSNMQSLSPTITRNILQSFMALVDSRVRSTVQAWYKHAQHDSSQRLMQILQVLSTMSDSLVTPTNAHSRTRVLVENLAMAGDERCAPVCMETTIQVEILGEPLAIVLEAAGTMRALLEPSVSEKIVLAKANFDTSSFLKILMSNARDIVKYATNKLFEIFLLPGNTHVANAMDPRVLSTATQKRFRTGDDEKECDSPRTVQEMSTQSTGLLQNSQLTRKSMSGVDLLKLAAESLS